MSENAAASSASVGSSAELSVDALPCAVVSVSAAGLIETVNRKFEIWTGRSASELRGTALASLLDEASTPQRLATKSGEHLDVMLTPGEPHHSKRVLVLTLAANGATEKALADANALLDTIFDTAPIGLGVWDRDLRFVRVNKRLAEINGVPPEAHIGKRPGEILPEIADIDDIYARWNEIFETGKSWNNIEVKGATPAAPGLVRTWNENFYPIKVNGRVVNIGAVVEETTERKRNLEHVQSLVMELNHRCKNLLSVVLAIARQTSRSSSPDAFVDRFTQRIRGLVASHDLLVQGDWTGVALSDLIEGQLAPFDELIGKRVYLDGPSLRLKPAAAQGLGMALHELTTNAAKYGALSTVGGQVSISWRLEAGEGGEQRFVMGWEERGGPAVEEPSRSGFGQLVTGKLLEAAIHGTTSVSYAPGGLIWSVTAPAKGMIE